MGKNAGRARLKDGWMSEGDKSQKPATQQTWHISDYFCSATRLCKLIGNIPQKQKREGQNKSWGTVSKRKSGSSSGPPERNGTSSIVSPVMSVQASGDRDRNSVQHECTSHSKEKANFYSLYVLIKLSSLARKLWVSQRLLLFRWNAAMSFKVLSPTLFKGEAAPPSLALRWGLKAFLKAPPTVSSALI